MPNYPLPEDKRAGIDMQIDREILLNDCSNPPPMLCGKVCIVYVNNSVSSIICVHINKKTMHNYLKGGNSD